MNYAKTAQDGPALLHHVKHRGYGITFCGKPTDSFTAHATDHDGNEITLCAACQANAGPTYLDDVTGELKCNAIKQPTTTTPEPALVPQAAKPKVQAAVKKAVKNIKSAVKKAKKSTRKRK